MQTGRCVFACKWNEAEGRMAFYTLLVSDPLSACEDDSSMMKWQPLKRGGKNMAWFILAACLLFLTAHLGTRESKRKCPELLVDGSKLAARIKTATSLRRPLHASVSPHLSDWCCSWRGKEWKSTEGVPAWGSAEDWWLSGRAWMLCVTITSCKHT